MKLNIFYNEDFGYMIKLNVNIDKGVSKIRDNHTETLICDYSLIQKPIKKRDCYILISSINIIKANKQKEICLCRVDSLCYSKDAYSNLMLFVISDIKSPIKFVGKYETKIINIMTGLLEEKLKKVIKTFSANITSNFLDLI